MTSDNIFSKPGTHLKQIIFAGKLHVILLTTLLLSLSLSSFSQGFLKVNGEKIQNEQQPDFIIRAMGLGGWMLQEGYMFHLSGLGQQYKIKAKITEMVGKQAADSFYKSWLHLHTQKADIDSMAAWGFNAVRLPIHYELLTLPVSEEKMKGVNTWLPKGFALIDTLLDWCKQNHIYLILDLHAAPGGQGGDLAISDRHPDQPSLWQSMANQDKTVALWAELAKRYKDEPGIGGYDILNETNWGFTDSADTRGTKEQINKPLRDLFIRITKAIRKVDKRHIIYLEGNGFANNYQGIFPLWDDNMVLSFHKYGNYSTEATIKQFLDYRKKYHVPLWLGESGENSNTWFTNTIRLMEDHEIGWSWWQLKKMGINNPLEIKEPDHYQAFVDYCGDKGPKPNPVEGARILNDLLTNIQIEHNIYHKDVVDAMFRQIRNPQPIPFKSLKTGKKEIFIQAADYDLGANGFAYNDLDSASYMYTPGVHTQGNRGHSYRNDGVDIEYNEHRQPVVFHIEDGEWLAYTLHIPKDGRYALSFLYKKGDQAGAIQILKDQQPLGEPYVLGGGTADKYTYTPAQTINLTKGDQTVRLFFSRGGFKLRGFIIRAL